MGPGPGRPDSASSTCLPRAYATAAQAQGSRMPLLALNAVNRIRYMEKHRRWPRAYRATVILHELLRSRKAGHRIALRCALRRSSWPKLVADLQVTFRGLIRRSPGCCRALPARQRTLQTAQGG